MTPCGFSGLPVCSECIPRNMMSVTHSLLFWTSYYLFCVVSPLRACLKHVFVAHYFAFVFLSLSATRLFEAMHSSPITLSLFGLSTTRLFEPCIRRLFFVLVRSLCLNACFFFPLQDLGARTYTEAQAAAVVRQVLSAILHAHQKGICHRDLKFENILWESKAEDAQIKVGICIACTLQAVRRLMV